jgi:thiosulfate/3-mercaptopyruvate sulfurtransferase
MMDYTTLIDPAALAPLIGKPGIAIVDCRFDLANPKAGRDAYLAGHIPGARFADLNLDLSAPPAPGTGRHPLPDPDVLAARLGSLGVGDATQVIAYDQANGSFAARLWWLLRWLGHGQAALLDGGFDAWTLNGGAVQSGEVREAAERFTPRLARGAYLTSAEVALALADPERLLVDARAPERYAGSVEPLDAIAGHVPSAVNHPFSTNLAPDGRFLPQAELQRRWRKTLAGKAAANAIAMCGSGVTACHNLLALEVAGFPGAKLYAGSWSEWISDPKRAVATGSAP